jgi:hypothetical protein
MQEHRDLRVIRGNGKQPKIRGKAYCPLKFPAGRRIRMVRISCDVCGRLKSAADHEWILGYDLQVERRAGLRRSVHFLDHWYDARVLELGAIHFCSEKCRDKYLEASKAA